MQLNGMHSARYAVHNLSHSFTPVQLPGCGGPSKTPAHNTSFEHRALPYGADRLLQDIQLLIQTGKRPPDKRVPILKRVKTDRGDYWRYPRPRP